ncbi:UNVERIFIED_CONTAM: hypothetical protein FKN15_062916, partial [Acipenser sinensis]
VRGYPEPQITWYKNGKPVTAGDRNGIEQSARGTFSLVIKDVQEEDGGKYTCEAVNDGGARQVTVELTVEGNARQKYNLPSTSKSSGGRFGVPSVDSRPSIWGESPPKFITKPSRLILKDGQSGKFSAKITGRPQPRVIWLKDDAELKQSDHFNLFEKSGIHFLEIRDAQPEDSGMYTCSVVNSAGKASASAELTVQRSPQPDVKWIRDGIPLRGKAGLKIHEEGGMYCLSLAKVQKVDRGQYSCTAINNRGQASCTWTLNVKNNTIQYAHATFDNGVAKLVVQDALPEDDGLYTCVAENSCGRTTCSAKVVIKEKKVAKRDEASKTFPPVFLKALTDMRVMDGSQVQMTVEVTGNPQPEIVWLHNGKEIQESEDFHFEKKENEYILYIQEVFPEDTGKYTCAVWNELGETRSEATLTVQEPQDGVQPWFISKPKSVTARLGQHTLLSCAIAGDPFPDFQWLKDGQEIVLEEDCEILQNEDLVTLLFRSVQPHHAGEYEIKLKNPVGDCSCLVSLLVREGLLSSEETHQTDPEKEADPFGEEGEGEVIHGTVRLGRSGTARKSPRDLKDTGYEADVRGLLKRRVETKEHCEDKIRQQEAEQVDFRTVLGKKVTTKSISEEDLKELSAEQMDFRANLQRQVKPKTLSEDDRKVHNSQQVDFRAVLGNPQPEIVWLHNGKEIQESEDFHFEKKENEYILYIQEVFPEDTGKYTCAVWNELGETRSEATLTVQEPQDGVQPWFISKPKSVTARLGQHTLLSCAIAGDPFPDFQWLKDGQEIVLEEDCEILQNEDLVTLLFRSVQPHHAGEYEIKLKNPIGDCSCLVSLLVREGLLSSEETHQTDPEKEPDPFGEEGEGEVIHGTVRLGRSGTARKSPRDLKDTGYEADVRGLLKRRVETKEHCEDKIRQQEAEQVDFRTVLGKKVTTKSISEEDLKELSAEQMDFRANLQRQVKPKTLSEDDRKVHNSQQVDFRAVLGKKSIPKVSIPEKSQAKNAAPDFRSVLGSKKKLPIENNNNNNNNDDSAGKKEVQNSQPDNKEQKNDANCEHGCPVVDGGIIGKKSNNIGKEPVFTEQLGDTYVTDGERLRLQCRVASDPPPVVTWSLDGKVIKSSKFIVLAQEGGVCSLTIDKALPEDEGQYKCIAENSAGRAECCCLVHVNGKCLPQHVNSLWYSNSPVTSIILTSSCH